MKFAAAAFYCLVLMATLANLSEMTAPSLGKSLDVDTINNWLTFVLVTICVGKYFVNEIVDSLYGKAD